jgi:AcrR family transcriptional regulator
MSQTKGEQTKESIQQAGFELFQENGYNGTSMRQIAERAGIALGGIYNHFSSKEEIFEAVLSTYHPYREIIKHISESDHADVESSFRYAAQMVDETLDKQPGLLNLMLIEFLEFRMAHLPGLLEIIFPEILSVFTRFEQTSEQTQVSIPMMMRTFMGTMIGYVITKNALGENMPAEFRENALQQFLDVYFYGILPRGSHD